MSIDASAVARVTGISTTYKNLRGGSALALPQRLAIFAQGATAATYPSTKFTADSAADVGEVMGYASQAYIMASAAQPANGDGISPVPMTIYPLSDGVASAAAAGDVTPSGTATVAGAYRVVIGGVESAEFVIQAGAVDVSSAVAGMGRAVAGVLGMPVVVGHSYGTVTATPDGGNTGDGTVTALSVTGVPIPGDYSLICNTAVADGGVFTMIDPFGSIVSQTVTMTPAPLGTTVIDAGGLQFTITDGAADFIVGDTFGITAPATDITFTAAWKGANTNDISLSVSGPSTGVVFAVSAMSGGLVEPSITAALAQVGDVWETIACQGGQYTDATVLDEYAAFGEARWGDLTRKPLTFVVGCADADRATATFLSATRTSDRTNIQVTVPGSASMPCVIAARAAGRAAKLANGQPGHDYSAQALSGVAPGTDGEQWDYAARDLAVKDGSSTTEIKGGRVVMSDTVTMYSPVGEAPPGYRHLADIVKLQNIIFNADLIFASSDWVGALLIPDDQPTTRSDARKPKHAKAALADMIDGLALSALISDPETAKGTIVSVIDSGNPKRLNVGFTVQLSGNTGIIDVGLQFGFYFGSAAVVA